MPADLAEVASRFHAVATRILDAKELPVDPWLYRYCGFNSDPTRAARYVRHQADLLELAGRGAEDAVVIDVGCGFGFALIVHALLGARSVHGIEVYPGMVSTVEAYMPLLPPEVSSRMTIARASAGLTRSSASIESTQSPPASESARFFCAPKPCQAAVTTCAPFARAISGVP